MSEFIKKAQEALERAEEDLESKRKSISPDYAVIAEREIQLSTAWQVLYNLVAMDS